MRRRDVLRLGATIPAVLASRRARAQTGPLTRAAIVIGVDRPRDMPPLRAAVSGARKVADWLGAEGIDVKPFYDDTGPVKAELIFDAVDAYVQLGTLKQLIVYFAGHGSFVGTGEYWLLSQALHNSNEAVSVTQCIQSARQCGIPNVVLISDACRSTSASLNVQPLTGYNIFPVQNNRRVFTYLDMFFAVRLGAPAYEVKDSAGKYDGIYTSCFLDAYVNPDAAMIEEIGGLKVVPNKKLENYLLSEVPKRAQISDVQEYPDSSVTSSEFIGQAEIIVVNPAGYPPRPGGRGCGGCRGCRGCGGCRATGPTVSSVPPTIQDLTDFKLDQIGVHISPASKPKTVNKDDLQKIDQSIGFSASSDSILNARGPNVFRFGTGVNIFGTRLRGAAAATATTQVDREGNGSSEPAVVQIDPRGKRQHSLVLEFEGGSGAVIAALQGFAATIIVAEGRVVSVSYEPAMFGDQLATSPINEELKQLHAVVATAAKFGAFRIDGPPDVRDKNAARLADALRLGKSLDPTLGIYAAYAYAQAGLTDQIASVRSIMQSELGIDLFDIAMLANTAATRLSISATTETQAPFCPMLNQGWQFLQIKNVALPARIMEAMTHILPSLWTTFDEKGVSLVKEELGISSSRLQ